MERCHDHPLQWNLLLLSYTRSQTVPSRTIQTYSTVQSTNSSGSPGPALAILVTPMTRTPTPGRMATHSAQTGPNIPSFQHPSSLNPVRPESSSCVRPVRLFGVTLFPTLGSPAVAGPSCYPASVPGRESFALRGLASSSVSV
jgi:hypothetical protein